MKSLWNSFLIALSMYSRIPVPQAEWTEKNLRWALCFFPLVGAVIGALGYGVYCLCEFLALPQLLAGALLTALPVVVTGGIHLDGFCDTTDAISSRLPREKKLEILKDPHAGAFAVLWCAVYFIVYFSSACSISLHTYLVFLSAYVFTRALSALSVANFPTAKEGLVSAFKQAGANRTVTAVSLLWIAGAAAFSLALSLWPGLVILAAGVVVYLFCVIVIFKTFGGISGDLAGWMLQVTELFMLLAAAIGGVLL